MRYAFILGMIGFGLTACEDTATDETLDIVSVLPADGAANVSRTTDIQVTFSDAMDMESCETRFGIFHGKLDSIPAQMQGAMQGNYSWNEIQTEMTFHPDSLMDSTWYSICLQEGMMSSSQHGDGMMQNGMMNHGQSVSGGIISTFLTQ